MSQAFEVMEKASRLLAEHGDNASEVAAAAFRFCAGHGNNRAADFWLEILRAVEAMTNYPSGRIH